MLNVALHALSLFDGYGGFELGFRLAGLDVRTVARVERDSHAAATLVARMDEATLDRAPVWDDVTTFDGRPWRGRVDIVTAGFNCQPFSAAGQRRGVDDERWLWGDIARIIADVGPRYVYLENVTGLVRHGLPYILADLADLGFDAEWGCLSAAAVGASHRRERFWLLAHRQGDGRLHAAGPDLQQRDISRDGTWSCSADVGHTEDVADAARARRDERRRQAVEPPEIGRSRVADGSPWWPPRPDDHDGWVRWRAESGPEPSVCRSTDGRPVGLAESLHLGGNGLVPRVAAEALAQLAARAGWGRKVNR